MTKQAFLAAALLLALGLKADAAKLIPKERAVARIDACLKRGDVSKRVCSDLNANIDALIDVYKSGDKSVLRELFKFTYLTNFFDEAFLADPDGFLAAMSGITADRRHLVAEGLAGEMFRTLPKERFLAIKSTLEAVPRDSPNRGLADVCLKALEEHNASRLVDYFPQGTFTGPAGNYRTDWFSRVLYAFGEAPLWRSTPNDETTWRFTYIGAWGWSRTVTLTVHSKGEGTVTAKWSEPKEDGKLHTTDPLAISPDQVQQFLGSVKEAEFWDSQTQVPSSGLDGAEWLLEGKQDGRYRLIVRWCPGVESKTSQTRAFAQACRLLMAFAGHPIGPDC